MSKRYHKQHSVIHELQKSKIVPENAKFMAFTQRYDGITNQIQSDLGITPVFDPKDYPGGSPFPITSKKALWDTGATQSVLTSATVKEMKLTPIGKTTVNHAGGSDESPTYLVNFILPNRVIIIGVMVTECKDIVGNFGAIIGMDIITKGDFSITNFDGKTCISYRFPSKKQIDYVEEFKRLNGKS